MREFYFNDKSKNVAFRGIVPSNDVNCAPFDYYRFSQAELSFKILSEQVRLQCPIDMPEEFIRNFALDQVDEHINNMLASSPLKSEIHQLLLDNNLSSKEQEKLLMGMTLTPVDILWLNKDAQELGYLLDIYHEETYPIKFDEKQKPVVLNQNEDKTIETIGKTNMSEGEMRALLEQRKVIQARIYHKDPHWHCFYFTFKGLAGQEKGVMGMQPHYHYLSDKSGIEWDELIDGIKKCKMPASKVHIIINK